MYRWFMLALVAVPLIFTLKPSPNTPLSWWTTHALEKIRPYSTPPAVLTKSVKISAAANEFEPFQIVLRPELQDIEGIDVEVSDLREARGKVISRENISIYFEGFMDLQTPSSIEGGAGEWPDPLIPRIDRYAGEKRNAFPFRVARGRNQPLWIEVYVPRDAEPGVYRGDVIISIQGRRTVSVPVSLNVWDFALPSTSSLPTSFGLNGVSTLRQHHGRYTNDSGLRALTHTYQKAALWHRLSIHGGTMAPPPFRIVSGRLEIIWEQYDAEVGPFLDGQVFSEQEPLYGARATSVELRTSSGAQTDAEKIAYWRQFAEHFREKGWNDRLFNYLWDEPDPGDYPSVLARGKLVRLADHNLKNLITAPLRPEWSSIIDIWSPLINCFESKSGRSFCDPTVTFKEYSGELAKGKRLWWYQSCGSHGCDIVGGEYFRGWPSYIIDNTGVANRIMQWQAWKYGIQGELYFNTTEAFARKEDPWADLFLFGGNGDGTMLYPGRPDRIGGKTGIPIESIRLKLIREGLEDYEYLVLLDRVGASEVTSAIVNSLVRKTYDFERDPANLYAARFRIGEELNRRGSGSQ